MANLLGGDSQNLSQPPERIRRNLLAEEAPAAPVTGEPSKKEYSAGELIGRAFMGFPKEEAKAQQAYLAGTAKPVLGLAQIIPYEPIQKYAAGKVRDIESLSKNDPLMRYATEAGALTSEAALTAAPLGRAFELTKPLKGAARYFADIGIGAGTGGLAGALTTTASDPSKVLEAKKEAAKSGALWGGGISAGVPLLGAAVKGLIGTTSPLMESRLKGFEDRGYEFSTSQVRQDKPLPSPGPSAQKAAKNERLATEDVTSLAGAPTQDINEKYVNGVLQTQGKRINEVFDRSLPINTESADLLSEIAKFERSVNPAGNANIAGSAENLLRRWKEAYSETQRKTVIQQIQKQIQKQQKKILRRPGVGPSGAPTYMYEDFHTLYDVKHPNAPEWLKDAQAAVDELSAKLGYRNTPKLWAGDTHRPGLYGVTWIGTDNMIARADLPRAYAMDTVIHEFGHQAEWQAFIDAPPEVQDAILAAHRAETQRIPFGSKTVEQLRPVTSRKYPQEAREAFPTVYKDQDYFRNFHEWFAENVSRWITQTKQPTNIVEKFFKKIADGWKEIYGKITGHVPIAPEMKAWLDARAANRVPENLPQETTEAIRAVSSTSKESPFIVPREQIVASIPGTELQALRTKLSDIARNKDTYGSASKRAGELIQLIDEKIMGQVDPQLAVKLRDANAKYAVGKAMEDGLGANGWITPDGKVDLKRLDEWMTSNVDGYGSGRTGHPLVELGRLGHNTGLTSRYTGTRYPPLTTLSGVLGRSKAALVNALASATNPRALQRSLLRIDRAPYQTGASRATILEQKRKQEEKERNNAAYSR